MSKSPSDHLLQAYSNVSTHNLKISNHAAELFELLNKASIEFILLKGADILPRLYGIRGLRPMHDVDILIHKKDPPAIAKIINSLGYRRIKDGNLVFTNPENTFCL